MVTNLGYRDTQSSQRPYTGGRALYKPFIPGHQVNSTRIIACFAHQSDCAYRMFDLPQELLDSPALSPPPGVAPVFSRTSPDQKWYFICVPLFTIIPGLFMTLRFYTKIMIVRKVNWADCEDISCEHRNKLMSVRDNPAKLRGISRGSGYG
jgi:hypothetical protein